ncbi:MAG: flagellar biosynthesis anti-sigma factor FlgM [Desulfobacteraceae bacterium]|jgi:flagellar biosynthesis anti-sigma factor FlgM
MKVSQNNSPIQMDAYIKQIQQNRMRQQEIESADAAQRGVGDKVQLSSRAKEMQQAVNGLARTEEMRDEKVRQVKMDIDRGTYKVNTGQVATDMLKEAFENNRVLKRIDTRA